MPLPHLKPIENNLVYTNRYSAIFLFSDDSYEHLNTELIDIDIDEKNSDRKINLKIVETFDTPFNFGDVECIIIDVHSATGDIKVRKIFDVNFISYHQRYGNESNKFKDELSIINVCFEIKDIQILQDSDLINLEAFIRDRKLKKLIE